jgi:hypothetical protein
MIWRPVQLAYIPHVASLLPLVQDDTTNGGSYYSSPESMPLYLPSSLPPEIRQCPEPSWIWLVTRLPKERGDNQTEEEFNHSMRSEWAQTRACMCWWSEELLIIQEEMRPVLAFWNGDQHGGWS